jgi:hypothetical protein
MYDPLNVYRSNYKEFIDSIMKDKEYLGDLEYSEVHHVIPICCGGRDNDVENIRLKLAPRDHFIAHRLLAEENPDVRGLAYAYSLMGFIRGDEITPEEYERFSILRSINTKGENNPFYGKHHTEETKKKISESLIKSNHTRIPKLSESHKGISNGPHTEETKKKISRSLSGRSLSVTHIERLSKSHQGYIMSGETKKKISDSLIGREVSLETRKKISESNKGKVVSLETREKISESLVGRGGDSHHMYGKQHTEETKKKMSESQRGKAHHYTTFKMVCRGCDEEFISDTPGRRYCDKCRRL